MGTNAGSFLANLYLFAKEFKWIRSLLECNDVNTYNTNRTLLVTHFNMVFRYLDDLFAGNNNNLMDQYKSKIYEGMSVSKEHTNNFLDLNITIINGKFITKTHDKTDDYDYHSIKYPHITSNTPEASKHKIIIGETYRAYKKNTNYKDFKNKITTIIKRMKKHNKLNDTKLIKNITKYLNENPKITNKYGKNTNTIIKDISPNKI
jgi:hypothetical protein